MNSHSKQRSVELEDDLMLGNDLLSSGVNGNSSEDKSKRNKSAFFLDGKTFVICFLYLSLN
jgi:hypothetical protein